jgi:hypothetical protein
VPGVIVTQHSGDGKANQYFLRGFNLDHGTDFATYVDGMPVNMRSHAHGQGYSDLNFLIPELVQRIDYKKGTYFAGEGDFSSAGAAHMRLADSLAKSVASLSAGPYGYRRGVLADSFSAGDGSWLYGLEINRNDGPWEVPEHVRKYSGMLRYSRGTQDDGFNVTAMAYKNTWNASDQLPLRAVESGQVGRFGAIDPTDGGQTARYSLSYATRKRDAQGLFELDAYAVQSRLDLFSNFTYLLDDPEEGDQFRQSEHRRMLGLNASYSWLAEIGGIEMRNKLGFQSRYDNLSPVGLYRTAAQQRISTIREDRVKESSAGPVCRKYGAVAAVAAHGRRPALRCLPLRCEQQSRRQFGQGRRPHRIAQAVADLRPVEQDRVLYQCRQRLSQQRRARHDADPIARRCAIRAGHAAGGDPRRGSRHAHRDHPRPAKFAGGVAPAYRFRIAAAFITPASAFLVAPALRVGRPAMVSAAIIRKPMPPPK